MKQNEEMVIERAISKHPTKTYKWKKNTPNIKKKEKKKKVRSRSPRERNIKISGDWERRKAKKHGIEEAQDLQRV